MRRETREKARKLRSQGLSIGDIAETVGASKGSVSNWVRDIQLTEAQIDTLIQQKRHFGAQNKGAQVNRKRHEQARLSYQEAGRSKAREGNSLHMIGCMLYWAEGAKNRNNVNFVNSDPDMMRLFIRFLREELDVSNGDIVLYIHCHTKDEDEIARIEDYWLNLLNLPNSCHRKTLYKKGSNTRRNVLENGICGIRVYKTELVMHIFGAIQEYGGFEREAWLF